jgi:hypothetical protein
MAFAFGYSLPLFLSHIKPICGEQAFVLIYIDLDQLNKKGIPFPGCLN